MDEVIAHANKTNKSLEQWKSYAKKLEESLKDVSAKHNKVRDMYIDRSGALEGQARLKEAALQEIQRLDPSNKLLDPEYRKSIYDKEKEKVVQEMKKRDLIKKPGNSGLFYCQNQSGGTFLGWPPETLRRQ